MPRSDRDRQRQKVYDGEHPFWGAAGYLGSLADAERFYDRLLGQKTVQRRFPTTWTPPGSIAVIGGGKGGGSYHRGRWEPRALGDGQGYHTIVLTGRNLDLLVAVHELAHHLTRGAAEAHGWQFAEAMLWLLKRAGHAELSDKLRRAYRETGARYTPPRAKRQLSPEQAEAARARLAKIREEREAKLAAERGEWVIERWDPEAYGPRPSTRAEFQWGEVSGAGAWRGIRRWTTWPPNATVYGTRSGAERWAAQEREQLDGKRAAGASLLPIEIRVVSLADAQAHYEEGVERRNAHHRKLEEAR